MSQEFDISQMRQTLIEIKQILQGIDNILKEAEMPKQDTLKAPNCPECGKWLDKVRVRVLKQLSASGRAQPGDEGIAWICADCKGK